MYIHIYELFISLFDLKNGIETLFSKTTTKLLKLLGRNNEKVIFHIQWPLPAMKIAATDKKRTIKIDTIV